MTHSFDWLSGLARQHEPHPRARQPAAQRRRRPIRAPAGGAGHRAVVVELDGVHAAGHGRHDLERVAAGFEAVAHRGGDAVLDFQDGALGPDARRFDGFLQVHAVVDQVEQRLQRRGEDLAAAGQAQCVAHLAALERHHRRHRGRHALARRDRQGVAAARVVIVHVVVGDHAGAGHDEARAEQAVDGLRRADDVALAVGHGEMGRVLALGRLQPAGPLRRAGDVQKLLLVLLA